MNVEGTIFEIFPSTERKFRKTILGMLEKDFDSKMFFFSKEQDWKMQQRKKTKPKKKKN